MRDALAKGLTPAEFGIHVMRKEVAGMARVKYDVGLGDCTAKGAAAVADGVILEELLSLHRCPP
jgi:hypothetical protein